MLLRGMPWLGRHRDYGGEKSQADDVAPGMRDQTLLQHPGIISQAFFPTPLCCNPQVLGVRSVSTLAQTHKGLLLTTGTLQHLDQTHCLLLDTLLHTTLAHTKVSQCCDGEAPELFGSFPAAECHTCKGNNVEVGKCRVMLRKAKYPHWRGFPRGKEGGTDR